jgi:hypothetical protein
MTVLADYLRDNPHLTKLAISHQFLSAGELTTIIDYIKNNDQLKCISIRNCRLNSDELAKITQALKHSTSIEYMDFAYCQIDNADSIIELMKNHPSLLSINISDNDLNVDNLWRLFIVFQDNKKILGLDLSENSGAKQVKGQLVLNGLRRELQRRDAAYITSIVERETEELTLREIDWIQFILNKYQVRANNLKQTIGNISLNVPLPQDEFNTVFIVNRWLERFSAKLNSLEEELKKNPHLLTEQLCLIHLTDICFSVMHQQMMKRQYHQDDSGKFAFLMRFISNAIDINIFKWILPLFHADKVTLDHLYYEIFSFSEYLSCRYSPQHQLNNTGSNKFPTDLSKKNEAEKKLILHMSYDLNSCEITYYHLSYLIEKLDEYYMLLMEKKTHRTTSFYHMVFYIFRGKAESTDIAEISDFCKRLDSFINDKITCQLFINDLRNIHSKDDTRCVRYKKLKQCIYFLRTTATHENRDSFISSYRNTAQGFQFWSDPTKDSEPDLVKEELGFNEIIITENNWPSL